MRIGIDARFVQGANTGVTNYLLNLLRGIAREDKRSIYNIFLSDPDYSNRIPSSSNFHIRINTLPALLWKNLWLPGKSRQLKIDAMHFPAYTASFVEMKNTIVTIPDVIHKVNPYWFSRKELFLIELPVRMAIKKARKIIAISESTKRDIIRYYNISPEKIAVTLLAADSSFAPIAGQMSLADVKNKYNLSSDFILCVGVLFKRRNIERLLKAFSILKKKKGIEHKLVMVGPGRTYSPLGRYIDSYGLKGEVVYLGYVEQEDMPLLYNAASFFVYPSLYEGFGLPVLEAMSCGKAVITSNVSSLPEVAGDAGLLIDPYNTRELCEAMLRLIGDISFRKSIEEKALLRSKAFSWDRMSRETIKVYEELC